MPNLESLLRDLVLEDQRELSDCALERYVESKNVDLFSLDVSIEDLPIDAILFAQWQTPLSSLEEFKAKRCHYDVETNDWLVYYIKSMSESVDDIPPIIVRITEDGIDLIDGWHRTCGLLIFGSQAVVKAWVIR